MNSLNRRGFFRMAGAVGRILDALEAEGLAENTLALFSSDNGPERTAAKPGPPAEDRDANVIGYGTYCSIGDTGGLRGRKRSLFEGGVRAPFIVRWPGHAPAGVRNDTTVFTAVDLLPTLCAAAGVKLPDDYHGDDESLLAALKGQRNLEARFHNFDKNHDGRLTRGEFVGQSAEDN